MRKFIDGIGLGGRRRDCHMQIFQFGRNFFFFQKPGYAWIRILHVSKRVLVTCFLYEKNNNNNK